MPEYSAFEMIAFTGSRQLEDKKIVFVGTGLPIIAAMHAQLTHAPNLYMIYEAGSLAPILEIGMPLSVGDTRAGRKACYLKGLCAVFELTQRGFADYAFIGGAQIDMYGNINSTMIGEDYLHPKVRLPGSGGANDFASLAWKTLSIVPHDRRKFVSHVDFITSPGYINGPGAREAAGLPPGTGPYKVISTLAVMGFDTHSKRMCVESLHPGVDRADIEANTGFNMLCADQLPVTAEPTDEELEILRHEVDPQGMIIGKWAT